MFSLAPTPIDVRLVAFGIPVRVHPSFWLSMIVLGWNLDSPRLIFLWVVCGFFSVLIHELGHAVTAEWFGWPSEIVLYFGGGVAISERFRNHTPWRSIIVSFMGPMAGFLLLLQVYIIIRVLSAYHIDANRYILVVLGFLYFMNLYWGLLNLLPVLPLDGGNILQSLCVWFRLRDPQGVTLKVGAAVGAMAAYYFLVRTHQEVAGILMLMLCLQNGFALQSRR